MIFRGSIQVSELLFPWMVTGWPRKKVLSEPCWTKITRTGTHQLRYHQESTPLSSFRDADTWPQPQGYHEPTWAAPLQIPWVCVWWWQESQTVCCSFPKTARSETHLITFWHKYEWKYLYYTPALSIVEINIAGLIESTSKNDCKALQSFPLIFQKKTPKLSDHRVKAQPPHPHQRRVGWCHSRGSPPMPHHPQRRYSCHLPDSEVTQQDSPDYPRRPCAAMHPASCRHIFLWLARWFILVSGLM